MINQQQHHVQKQVISTPSTTCVFRTSKRNQPCVLHCIDILKRYAFLKTTFAGLLQPWPTHPSCTILVTIAWCLQPYTDDTSASWQTVRWVRMGVTTCKSHHPLHMHTACSHTHHCIPASLHSPLPTGEWCDGGCVLPQHGPHDWLT